MSGRNAKKVLTWVLTFSMLLGMMAGLPLFAFADGTPSDLTGSCGSGVTYEITPLTYEDDGVTIKTAKLVISGNGSMNSFTIPNGYSPAPWKSYADKITTVEIRSGVTSIGAYAFRNFSAATNYSIPTSVKTIGEYAFIGNTQLQSITLSSSVINIQRGAFLNCFALKLKKSASYAASTAIDKNYNDDLIQAMATPGTMTKVASGDLPDNLAWYLNDAGTLVVYNKSTSGVSMRNYGEENPAPWCTDELKDSIKNVVVESCIESIGERAFAGLTKVRFISIGPDVGLIGSEAFKDSSLVTSIEFPYSVNNIRQYAFNGTYLQSVSTPRSSKSITVDKAGNARLRALLGHEDTPTDIWGGSFGNGLFWYLNASGTMTIDGTGAIPDFSGTDVPWKDHLAKIKYLTVTPGITEVGKDAFDGASNLQTVSLPSTVTTIDEDAFKGCAHITDAYIDRERETPATVTINNGNTYLTNKLRYKGEGDAPVGPTPTDPTATASGTCGENAKWAYYASSKTLKITGTGAMADYAEKSGTPWYGYLGTIEELIVEQGVTTVGKNALNGALSLKEVTLAESVRSAEENAFYNTAPETAAAGCKKTEFTFKTGNEPLQSVLKFSDDQPQDPPTNSGSCGENATWAYNATTKTLTISGTGAMTDYASAASTPWASYMTGIEKLVVSSGVTTVGKNALNGATALKTVMLGETVKSAGDNAFTGCSALTSAMAGCKEEDFTFNTGNQPLQSVLKFSDEPPTASGSCGENATWAYNATTKTLTISGTGPMTDYESFLDAPWLDYVQNIENLVVTQGVTSVGANALGAAYNLKNVRLAESVRSAGDGAFNNCSSLVNATAGCKKTEFTFNPQNSALESVLKFSDDPQEDPPTPTYSGSCGANATWAYNPTSKTLTISGTGAMTNYASFADTPWADYALSIENLVVEQGVTTVGNYALGGAYNLKTVTLAESVRSAGAGAFTGCLSLNSATAGCKETEFTINTGNQPLRNVLVFAVEPGTTEITGLIPGTNLKWSYSITTKVLSIVNEDRTTVEAIPDYANSTGTPWKDYADQIRYVAVTNAISRIGNNAFADMPALEEVLLQASLTEIGDGAFANDPMLDTIDLPNKVSAIGEGAFKNCTKLPTVELPSGLKEIEEEAFAGCVALEELVIPEGVTKIGKSAFKGCTALKYLDLPNSLETIDKNAFDGCTALNKILVKCANGLTVADYAFDNCDALQSGMAICTGDYRTFDIGDNNEDFENALVNRYGSGNGWSVDRLDGVLTISGDGVVSDNSAWKNELKYVNTVIVEDGVTGIGDGLFYVQGRENIEKVVLPDTLETIGAQAFRGCSNLKKINLPDSLTSIGTQAFNNCDALESVVIPDSVTVIPEKAFLSCDSLKSVKFGKNLTSIGDGAFKDCEKLEELTIYKDKLGQLSDGIFEGCDALARVHFNGTQEEWDAFTENADEELEGVTLFHILVVTVKYVDENGNELAAPVYLSGETGDTVQIPVKTIDHYDLMGSKPAPVVLSRDETVTVKYSAKWYKLTFHYVTVDGVTLQEDLYGTDIQYGTGNHTFVIPNFAGYTAEAKEVVVSGMEMTGDRTVTVYFKPTTYCTVQYQTEGGVNVKASVTLEIPFDGVIAFTPEMLPSVFGYDVVEGEYSWSDVAEGDVLTILYAVKKGTLTIRYLADDGEQIAEPFTSEYDYFTKISIPSPEIEGFLPDVKTVEMDSYSGETEIRVTYQIMGYSVTIHYVDGEGRPVAEDKTLTLAHFTEIIPLPDGGVRGMHPETETPKFDPYYKGEKEVTVVYEPNTYKLTIHCVFIDGGTTRNLDDAEKEIVFGQENLSFDAPVIVGYTPKAEKVTLEKVEDHDEEITLEYTVNPYTVTILCVNEDGVVIKEETKVVTYGGTLEGEAPEVHGYDAKNATYKLENVTEDSTLTLAYTLKSGTLTVRFVDKDGKELADAVTKTYKYFEDVEIPAAEVTGMEPDKTAYTGRYDGETEATIVYAPKTYTLTIECVEVDTEGFYHMIKDETHALVFGDKGLSFDAPEIAGYLPDTEKVTVEEVGAENITKTVIYTPREYDLKLRFINDEGQEVYNVTFKVQAGKTFEKNVKEILENTEVKGYEVVKEVVSGTMPIDGLEIPVFVKEKATDDPGENPGGGDDGLSETAKVLLVVGIVVVALGGCAALFYFLYLKTPKPRVSSKSGDNDDSVDPDDKE